MADPLSSDRQTKLLADFVTSVLRRYEAMDDYDNKTQRRCLENMIRIIKELDTIAPEGRTALTKLFDHDEIGVRVMAASYLLNVIPETALPFLEALHQSCYGDEGIDAMTAIFKYKAGDWRI